MSFDIFSQEREAQKNIGGSAKNIAVIVESYDTSSADEADHKVFGINYETGEKVAVALDINRRDEAAQQSTFEPPRIRYCERGDDVNESLDNRIVKAGGLIIFSNVVLENDVYRAAWLRTINHNNLEEEKDTKKSQRNALFAYLANVRVGLKKATNEPYAVTTIILEDDRYYNYLSDLIKPRFTTSSKKPVRPVKLAKVEHIKKYAIELISKGFGLIVRFHDAETPNAISAFALDSAGGVDEKAAEEYIAKRLGKVLGVLENALPAKPNSFVEVIPTLTLWGGKNIKTKVANELTGKEDKSVRYLRSKYVRPDSYGNLMDATKAENRLFVKTFVVGHQMTDKKGNVIAQDDKAFPFIWSGIAIPQHHCDFYTGIDNAAYYLDTEWKVDGDKAVLLNNPSANLDDFRISYENMSGKASSEENENFADEVENTPSLANLAKAQTKSTKPAPVAEPDIDFDDSDIPF